MMGRLRSWYLANRSLGALKRNGVVTTVSVGQQGIGTPNYYPSPFERAS